MINSFGNSGTESFPSFNYVLLRCEIYSDCFVLSLKAVNLAGLPNSAVGAFGDSQI